MAVPAVPHKEVSLGLLPGYCEPILPAPRQGSLPARVATRQQPSVASRRTLLSEGNLHSNADTVPPAHEGHKGMDSPSTHVGNYDPLPFTDTLSVGSQRYGRRGGLRHETALRLSLRLETPAPHPRFQRAHQESGTPSRPRRAG